MPQAKKKQSTRTAKKSTARAAKSKATKRTTKTSRTAKTEPREKWHVYIMTALSMILAILLCANAAIMAVL
ncbi:hypothetical protein IJJ37_02580 [Candidatus Saccharibacteria bacterium]|nr:hypothetical protein [Candidatus Saccharibacteria bacterium]